MVLILVQEQILGFTNSVQDKEGNIFIVGNFTEFNGVINTRSGIAKLWMDGSLMNISHFNPGIGTNFEVRSIALQDDGKLLIGGDFTTYNGTTGIRLPGSIQMVLWTQVSILGLGQMEILTEVLVQSDGKIIIAGDFENYNGTSRNYIARLNSNGTLDPSFNPGIGPNDEIEAIALTSDGRLYIGGYFTEVNGVSRNRIARLYANGSLDTSFDPGTGTNGLVGDIALTPTGHIVIGGEFSFVDGIARGRVAWLDLDGAVWAPFNSSVGANSTVWSVAVLSDGQIIIGGLFSQVNGVAQAKVAKLDIFGALDTSFNPGAGANNGVFNITLQNDGKVLVGGDFTTMDNYSLNRIAKLNPDGTVDFGVDTGNGTTFQLYALETVENEKMLIAGSFDSFDGFACDNFARLNADGSYDTTFYTADGPNAISHEFCPPG